MGGPRVIVDAADSGSVGVELERVTDRLAERARGRERVELVGVVEEGEWEDGGEIR